jgi:Insertion element 4 transposase N-terminal
VGELTRIIPFEMVDAVLAECGAAQRLRKLPGAELAAQPSFVLA